MPASEVIVGLAQFAPVHNDLQSSLEKMTTIIKEAAESEVELLVFGETWLSGYPAWIDHCPEVAVWDDHNTKVAYRDFAKNSVTIDGHEIETIARLARENTMAIVLGINERVDKGPGNGTIYNSVVIIDHNGIVKVHHRKLMPTFTEKMLYGVGNGEGLEAGELSFGRAGALICWEHWMPLTRQAMHNSGEHIHIALWPQVHEMLQLASRHYAFEGRCYVLAVGQIMDTSQIPPSLKKPAGLKEDPSKLLLNGGSCIIGPNGKFIIEPVFNTEQLIVAKLNLDKIVEEQMTLDVSGHYQRPDVFDFTVKTVKDNS